MNLLSRHTVIVTLLCAFCFSHSVQAQKRVQDEEKEGRTEAALSFIDRWAFKTNAFEWLLTIPNFGVEFDLTNSEYNSWTVGLTTKYNWKSYHNMNPSIVFNLLDVRPEFRYWFRYTQKPKRDPSVKRSLGKWFRDEIFTTARKNPRHWRAQYLGLYVDYANYAFKFGPKGIQGHTLGFGTSAGYSIPMYEYKNGSIDVELGFSVGLQFCTREVFTHNVDGNYYTKLPPEEGTKGWHFTPFPVLSELRAAFVWRHKSIKEKVKVDEEKIEERMTMERNANLVIEDIDRNLPVSYKIRFDNNFGSDELRTIKQNDSLYRAKFEESVNEQVKYMKEVAIQDPMMAFDKATVKRLNRKVDARKREVMAEFEHLWLEEQRVMAEKERERLRLEEEARIQREKEMKQKEKEARQKELEEQKRLKKENKQKGKSEKDDAEE